MSGYNLGTHTRCGLPLGHIGPYPDGYWDRLRQTWPDGARLTAAWELAPDLDTVTDLLAGRPVDVGRLNADGYRKARQRRLVTLRRPLGMFDVQDAA